MTARDHWLEVDRAGLGRLLEDRGREFVLYELIANAWDEPGVSEVRVTLTPSRERGRWLLAVVDDAPDGFADLTHAYRLYAESAKKANPVQRGRFNLGEKLVLAVCESATVVSTRGAVDFAADGSRRKLRRRRDRGTEFSAVMRISRAQAESALQRARLLIPPPGVATFINGQALAQRSPVRVLAVTELPTVVDVGGQFRRSARNTTISLYEPLPGEVATLYEMGIPVVESGDRWHADIGQKVPLNADRDNVTPAFLRRVRTDVLNGTHDLIDAQEAAAPWVSEAIEDPRVEAPAVREVVAKRFGPGAVAYDPSDREANGIAFSSGRTVVHGSSLSRAAWAAVRRSEALPPAGRVTPSSRLATSPDGVPPIPREQWTPGMTAMAGYARALAEELLGHGIVVEFTREGRTTTGGTCEAAYADGRLLFNLRSLGHRFFDEPDQERTDRLLLHEFAHDKEADHLSAGYHEELCRLGARMRAVTVRVPLPARA